MGQTPAVFFGKAITSRIVLSPAMSMTSRSSPGAIPPCGGAPYLNASSRKPNRRSASSSGKPTMLKIRRWIAGSWILIDPEASSTPLQTRS